MRQGCKVIFEAILGTGFVTTHGKLSSTIWFGTNLMYNI